MAMKVKALVPWFRDKYANGGYSYATLARELGLSSVVVGKIVRRDRWVHI